MSLCSSPPPLAPSSAEPSDGGGGPASDAGGAGPAPGSTAEAEADIFPARDEIVSTGTVGDGTWTFARPSPTSPEMEGAVRTYAVRVENGIGIDAEVAATEIAAILTDERGWQPIEGVVFTQIAAPEDAEFTISVASPPTTDELCLPARTGGIWSCRVGPEVALNSDRWLHATPTFADLSDYRAYMVNHEVGHFLGHGHAEYGGEGQAAPVMLQQSMDLQGCTPNPWPAADGAG